MAYFWAAAAIAAAVLEAVTVQLVSIWFVVGAAAAFFAALLGAEWGVQVAVFAAVSAVLLICTRPLTKKLMRGRGIKTNADGLIGTKVLIDEAVDNIRSSGSARISGTEWSVKSEDGSPIESGTLAEVVAIEGVKLVVKARPETVCSVMQQ